MTERDLTVAVTGPTGTFGFGLIPLLQADDRVGRIVGIARRPFDPAAYGWTKMEYRRGDVRDPEALRDAFGSADVVVHLAFLVTGAASPEVIRSVNLDGTLNAFRAAAAAGARRFVYASSVAAYGFHPDNPVGMTEDWPVRPAARLFYARQKAELESLLQAEAARAGSPALYLLRPPIVLGPDAVGAKDLLPGPLAPLGRGRGLAARFGRLPLPVPVLVPALPLQFVHEEDLGQAFVRCIVAAGPPGAVQHRRRRDPHRRRRGPGTRPGPAAPSRGPGAARGPGRGGPAVPAARRAVGRGGQPSGDRRHDPGQGGTWLGSPLHGARGPAGHRAAGTSAGPAGSRRIISRYRADVSGRAPVGYDAASLCRCSSAGRAAVL